MKPTMSLPKSSRSRSSDCFAFPFIDLIKGDIQPALELFRSEVVLRGRRVGDSHLKMYSVANACDARDACETWGQRNPK
jgi:hypothetical protein